MNSVAVTLGTAVAGAIIGFAITRLNDWIVERHEIRRARQHLLTEVSNVGRHYSIMLDKLKNHADELMWRNAINVETCRFYGTGLGTFDLSALRLFDEPLAEEALFLLIMVRNNNSYVDEAKAYLAAKQPELFHEVCEALVERCESMIERARRLEAMLRAQSMPIEPSARPVL